MAGEDDIDWGGFDYVAPPAPVRPAAQLLAEQIDADVIDQSAVHIDFDVKYEVVSPYETKDALKHLGCRWNGTRKRWVAKDAEMFAAATAIVDKHYGRNQKRNMATKVAQAKSQAGHQAKKIPIGTVVSQASDGTVDVVLNMPPELPPQTNPPGQWIDSEEAMIAALRARGYTVAKLGQLDPLAQLLADQDESDPFGELEEL